MIQSLKYTLQWSLEFVASVYVEKLMYMTTQKVYLSININNTSEVVHQPLTELPGLTPS